MILSGCPQKTGGDCLCGVTIPWQKKAGFTKGSAGLPLIASRQSLVYNELSGWLGKQYDSFQIVTTYNLLYNASLFFMLPSGRELPFNTRIRILSSLRLFFTFSLFRRYQPDNSFNLHRQACQFTSQSISDSP